MIGTVLKTGALVAPLLLAACAAPVGGYGPYPVPQAYPPRTQAPPPPRAAPQGSFERAMIDEHQRARRDFGVAPLRWDAALAADAGRWANEMARTGRYAHSPRDMRSSRQGENIWRGTRGAFSYAVMAGTFTAERRYFRAGVFPNNSTTGNWRDVGHYTAIVWPTTTHFGCAIASNRDFDYLVCRYSPPGNRDGVRLAPR